MKKKRSDHVGSAPMKEWFVEDPRAKVYAALLEWAVVHADQLVLTAPPVEEPDKPYVEVLKLLSSNLIKPPTIAKAGPGVHSGLLSKVYRYRYDVNCMRRLVQLATGMLDWRYPDRPEDLSLLRAGEEWLYSVAHEAQCVLKVSEEEMGRLQSHVPGLRVLSGPGYRSGSR